jgi:hypothetical protein
MRKFVAFILLIPFAILLFGSMTLSNVCPVAQQDTCTGIPDQCCHRQSGKSSCHKDRPSDRSACCFDCPLCALITVPPFIRFEPTRAEIASEYAVRPDHLLTDYYQHPWKPPDAARLS